MGRVRTAAAAGLLLAVVGCSSGSSADPKLFCARLERLTQNDPFTKFGDAATTAEMRAAFDALHVSARALAHVAPDEGRRAATDYADAVDRMRSLMAGAAFDGSQVDLSRYRDAELDYYVASGRLERYLHSSC